MGNNNARAKKSGGGDTESELDSKSHEPDSGIAENISFPVEQLQQPFHDDAPTFVGGASVYDQTPKLTPYEEPSQADDSDGGILTLSCASTVERISPVPKPFHYVSNGVITYKHEDPDNIPIDPSLCDKLGVMETQSPENMRGHSLVTASIPLPSTTQSSVHHTEYHAEGVKDKDAQIAALSAEVAHKSRNEKDLTRKLGEVSKEKQEAEQQLLAVNVSLQEMQQENKCLQEEIKRKISEIERLKGKIDEQKTRIAETEKNNVELKKKHKTDISALSSQLDKLRAKEAESHKMILQLMQDKHDLEKKVLQMENGECDMRRVLAEERESKAVLRAELAEEKTNTAERELELQRIASETKIQTLEAQLALHTKQQDP